MENLKELRDRLEPLTVKEPYREKTRDLIQLAIAERLDGILTEMKGWQTLIRVGSDGLPGGLNVHVKS